MGSNRNSIKDKSHDYQSDVQGVALDNFRAFVGYLFDCPSAPYVRKHLGGYPYVRGLPNTASIELSDLRTGRSLVYDFKKHLAKLPDDFNQKVIRTDEYMKSYGYLRVVIKVNRSRNGYQPIGRVYEIPYSDESRFDIIYFLRAGDWTGPNYGLYPFYINEEYIIKRDWLNGKYILVFMTRSGPLVLYYFGSNQYKINRNKSRKTRRSGRRQKLEKQNVSTINKGFEFLL